MPDGSSITALLGPTNTGKTHRAIERMLAHPTGMMGLPLRLLAREVYDKITARLGEGRVALVTGEEKRVPRRPDYWVCTVEAMPVDLEVDFVAVDEIQLAAHPQRGHVFTDRLLRARGKQETWFLGSDTMRPLVQELLPTAVHAHCARLSRLGSAGVTKIKRLPPRSAVVAFSVPEVYALAERLRVLRGGAAVVLGALSPRTRNAQVALFQSGEVDTLVATDAIGMGLNLDVGHVAFASMRKFDGKVDRELDPAELGQIAGRAGRYLRDGTFGTLAPLVLPESLAAAVEAHHFAPVRRLSWRNPELDFTSIESLVASLRERPRRACLHRVQDVEDAAALDRLALDPAVRARARGEEAVRLLWDVCTIPDFRKLLLETHVALLAEIYEMLSGPRGVLDPAWMQATIEGIDDIAGDVDTLTARIAAVRTWTYISHQTRWLHGASEWQARTRAVEDRLSDALHERLVQRFVEKGSTRRIAATPPRNRASAPAAEAEARPDSPFAQLMGLKVALAPLPERAADASDVWVEEIVAAPHQGFEVDAAGRISAGDRPLGQLMRGTALLLPDVKLSGALDLGPGARSRILRRLLAFARDLAAELLAPLRAPELRALTPAGRGLVYQLEQGLGTTSVAGAEEQIGGLGDDDRALLAAQGVVLGERLVYLPALLEPRAVERRAALAAAWFGGRARMPSPGVVSLSAAPGAEAYYAALGFPVFGGRAVRADVAERVARIEGAEGSSEHLSSLLGCPARDVPRIVAALALDIAPLDGA